VSTAKGSASGGKGAAHTRACSPVAHGRTVELFEDGGGLEVRHGRRGLGRVRRKGLPLTYGSGRSVSHGSGMCERLQARRGGGGTVSGRARGGDRWGAP